MIQNLSVKRVVSKTYVFYAEGGCYAEKCGKTVIRFILSIQANKVFISTLFAIQMQPHAHDRRKAQTYSYL